MSNRHELGNMIFNLENRKNLKEVNFTKDAVREVLGYLKELYEIKNKEHEEDRRVADLEAKLADKESEHELLINQFEEETEKLRKQIKQESDARKRFVEEVKKLKQQLAEKEKEIEKSQLMLDKILTEIHTNCYSGLNIVKFKEMVINDLGGIVNSYNQDKISFAVERLEKVKEFLFEQNIEITRLNKISDFIDNQIKLLKEGK